MVDFIKDKYFISLPSAVITGDSLGKNGQISERDNASLYLQLMRGLGMRESQIQVPNNPRHENSKADCDYVMLHYPDYKVHRSCVGIIRDARNVQVDSSRKIIKANRSDPNQRADFLDAGIRYPINTFLCKWLDFHQRKFGYKKQS